jgi:transcriptional regulator with XRE-family HTH domain
MPKKPETTVTTISEVVGRNVRDIRKRRQQSVDEFAQAAAAAGHPELTRDAIYAIETGRPLEGRRRRTVSADELWAFAEVFDVPLSVLMYPLLQPTGQESTLVFNSPEERAGFMETVNKLIEQATGISRLPFGMKPAEQKEDE